VDSATSAQLCLSILTVILACEKVVGELGKSSSFLDLFRPPSSHYIGLVKLADILRHTEAKWWSIVSKALP
jgi:hypothetical protein